MTVNVGMHTDAYVKAFVCLCISMLVCMYGNIYASHILTIMRYLRACVHTFLHFLFIIIIIVMLSCALKNGVLHPDKHCMEASKNNKTMLKASPYS